MSWIALCAVALVQAAAVLGAWALRAREPLLRRYLPLLVSLAVGVLLATAILHLLPESVSELGNRPPVWWLMGGTLLALFCGERTVYAWTGTQPEPEVQVIGDCAGHDHAHGHAGHGTRPGSILTASMLHSFIDGAAVATAFAAGERVGGLTAFAIALHEIPHRMGDFALFVHLRVPPREALRMAVLAGVPSLAGVAAVALLGMHHARRIEWLLPVSAGSFLHIALVNLLPEIERERSAARVAAQIASLLAGVGLVALAGMLPA